MPPRPPPAVPTAVASDTLWRRAGGPAGTSSQTRRLWSPRHSTYATDAVGCAARADGSAADAVRSTCSLPGAAALDFGAAAPGASGRAESERVPDGASARRRWEEM